MVLKEKTDLERQVQAWEDARRGVEEALLLVDLAEEAGGDPATLSEARALGRTLEKKFAAMELQRLLGQEGDSAAAILEINVGAGGVDAQDWASMLLRMYERWGQRRGFKVQTLDFLPAEDAGIKSATLSITGPYAYGWLKAEIGVHRLVRISPFDAQARRQTSFAAVAAYPDIEDNNEIDVLEKDLRIDVFRSGGPGGQGVNTTDSAVRITHIPSGIVVQCQSERSQHKNKSTAMKVLKARLYEQELEKREAVAAAEQSLKKKIEWGSQIRSYVLQPYRLVKDHRTKVDESNVDAVLDGDLDRFMEAWLVASASGTLGQGGPDKDL